MIGALGECVDSVEGDITMNLMQKRGLWFVISILLMLPGLSTYDPGTGVWKANVAIEH